MNKKKDISGLIFSAFLVIAYVICAYFFIGLITSSTGLDNAAIILLKALVFVIFGLVLFYATRVGDGKQVKRFSLAALILVDIPTLYIILASAATGLPFPLDLSACPEVVSLAAVALGYGIPYTFFSGYELDVPVEDKSAEAEKLAETEDYEPDELDDVTEETEDSEEESADESVDGVMENIEDTDGE